MRRGEQVTFDAYYEELFEGRWRALRSALAAPPRHFALEAGLLKPYFLNEASVIAAGALGVRPGDRVLDLCAAPGGKALLLALAAGPEGAVVLNDRSSARRARLRRVLDEHLPRELRAGIRVTGHDATRWGLHERGVYDRILADVPCSSEQHLLSAAGPSSDWSPARSRHLALQAYAILGSALSAAKAGGTVLYCTCALAPAENDGVVAKLIERRGGEILVEELSGSAERPIAGEPTSHGWRIWPDRDRGLGPIYFSRIRKLPETESALGIEEPRPSRP